MVVPHDVPQKRWKLGGVIHDGGLGGWSLAWGFWDGGLSIARRWNGDTATHIGFPQSRGIPVWDILSGEEGLEMVLSAFRWSLPGLNLSQALQALARLKGISLTITLGPGAP